MSNNSGFVLISIATRLCHLKANSYFLHTFCSSEEVENFSKFILSSVKIYSDEIFPTKKYAK